VSFGLLAAHQGLRLEHASRVNAAIAGASAGALDDSAPEARFAHAAALAKAGEYDAALTAYKALIQGERSDLRLAASYNLGNLHLHEALKNGPDAATESLPLIELAKQSYRDVLRNDPADWDARYNLERALWLAPEVDAGAAEDEGPPPPTERSVTTARARLDLP
jgi:mxaK protein